ncbi:pancreatic lipase-related protein 2-like [Arctopsyche grandis]|uniref:pancreatic lipase-related protein 2-like n=1 Tax=Arctopsyche grandis TaxID=121162 RepID=UPI00406D89F0
MRKTNFILFLIVFVSYIKGITMDITIADIQQLFSGKLGDCEGIKAVAGSTYENVTNQSLPKVPQCLLKLYTPTDKITFTLANAAQGIIQSSYFDRTLPTVVLCHGYSSSAEDSNIVQVAKDLKSFGNLNVLTHDHSILTNVEFFLSCTNAQYAGEGLGKAMADLRNLGASRIHLIGYSLGAQVVSFAGKEFFRLTGSKINRISGLDPASTCFYKMPPTKTFDKSDAAFVDVLHTDMYFDGPIGHADFYANGGLDQPGCFSIGACDHSRVVYYFESIKNPNGFLSVKCSDWNTFLNRGCTNNVKTPMGFFCPDTTPPGSYYFKTKWSAPYALGAASIM